MKTHDEMVQGWMQDPAFVREYDGLEQEFALFDEMLRARKKAGLTQAEVADLCPGDLLGDRGAVDAICFKVVGLPEVTEGNVTV